MKIKINVEGKLRHCDLSIKYDNILALDITKDNITPTITLKELQSMIDKPMDIFISKNHNSGMFVPVKNIKIDTDSIILE